MDVIKVPDWIYNVLLAVGWTGMLWWFWSAARREERRRQARGQKHSLGDTVRMLIAAFLVIGVLAVIVSGMDWVGDRTGMDRWTKDYFGNIVACTFILGGWGLWRVWQRSQKIRKRLKRNESRRQFVSRG